MAHLIFLGTSNAISGEDHENTHMILVGETRTVLVDCPNSPMLRFKKAGVDFNRLTDLVLTHFHPDHVSGVPQLLMDMWLLGRTQPLNVIGLQHTIDRIETTMNLYSWSDWPGFYPVNFICLPVRPLVPVLQCEEFNIFASQVQHFIPTIGLRIEFISSKKIVAYSSDTEPCSQVVELARDADVLVHECSGTTPGHSTAAQAGEIARLANARSLYLIHYPTGNFSSSDLVAEARKQFEGVVTLAEDYMLLDFN